MFFKQNHSKKKLLDKGGKKSMFQFGRAKEEHHESQITKSTRPRKPKKWEEGARNDIYGILRIIS